MSQIVIVSNRLPVSVKKENGVLEFFPSVGGLATGLSSYVDDKRSMWIGWPGIASEHLTESDRTKIIEELAKHNCSPVFLTQKQIDDFYSGYSNTVLWPLFHTMRPQDQPGAKRDGWFNSYRTVNKLFAENVSAAAGSDSLVWVHDYQLLLVPDMLRKMSVNATIGYFHHIPFPEPKKFASLDSAPKILKGLLGADLIGFHTNGYVDNFLATCDRLGLGNVGKQSLVYDDRTVRVSNFPMGIDFEKYTTAGDSKEVKKLAADYRRKYRGKKLIVAVDRLDPSKGLPERVEAYGQFLEQHPEKLGKVVFIMVAAPSRTDVPAYKRLSERLDILVDQVNKRFSRNSWQPIEYINRTVPFEEVTALFQVADVAFIAPLRDGMNLAAKEFVASTHKDSVLILSETAGASEELKDAIIVNPRQPETVVEALQKSLTMRKPELRKRLKRMKSHLESHTVHTWAKDFMGTLQKPIPNKSLITRPLSVGQLARKFHASPKRLMLLDYDGTLVPFADSHDDAKPTKPLMELLQTLGDDPANDVVIISGRTADNLDDWFGKLPVHLVSDHGASYRLAGSNKWHTNGSQDNSWLELAMPIIEKYTKLTPGATIEKKKHSLVWHYRMSPPYYAQKYSVIIRRELRPILKVYGLEVQKGSKILEIKDPHNTKGSAAKYWVNRKYDFVLAAGDDVTDEQLFKAMPSTVNTVKVGRGLTSAKYRVKSYREIIAILKRFSDQ